MRLKHYISLIISSSYRKHYWLGRNLSKYRRVLKYIKTMLESDTLKPEFLTLYPLAKKIEADMEKHRKLAKEVRNARPRKNSPNL